MPLLSLLDTSLPGVVTLVPSILDPQWVVHTFEHCNHSIACIPGKGLLFFQLHFEQLLPFGPLHPVGSQVQCGALNLLFIVVVTGQLL